MRKEKLSSINLTSAMHSVGSSSTRSNNRAESPCYSCLESIWEASDLVHQRNGGGNTDGAKMPQSFIGQADDGVDLSQGQCADHDKNYAKHRVPYSSISNLKLPEVISEGDGEQNRLYPSQLKIMAAKAGLNSGNLHFTSKGKLREARRLKSPCLANCKRCDSPKLSTEGRENPNFSDVLVFE